MINLNKIRSSSPKQLIAPVSVEAKKQQYDEDRFDNGNNIEDFDSDISNSSDQYFYVRPIEVKNNLFDDREKIVCAKYLEIIINDLKKNISKMKEQMISDSMENGNFVKLSAKENSVKVLEDVMSEYLK